MTDPEYEYRRLVSGDPVAIRSEVDALDASLGALKGVREELGHAAVVPGWFGGAALAFQVRLAALWQGLSMTRSVVVRVRGALEAAAGAYERVEGDADYYISFWRNRPTALPGIVEEIFEQLVMARLLALGVAYNAQLAAIKSVIVGGEADLDDLDEETRKWVEEGIAKNKKWLAESGGGLGPLIPNTAATGDDRGLIPQGLGYDPDSGMLVQGYYTKAGESYVALIDPVTGQEIGEAELGGYTRPGEQSEGPTHAGGVTVVGDSVYVVDNGEVYTYSLKALRNATPGTPVTQTYPPQKELNGGSYSAYHDGLLYLGDHEKDKLYVYKPDADGIWRQIDSVDTPANCQGVLVRNGEFVFSASSGRHENHSQLYVQDFDGNRSQPYDLPSMSQGVVEVDGNLVVTYESGAEEFDHARVGNSGWWWGSDDYRDLWANRFMSEIPLSELSLSGDISVDPDKLRDTAAELATPADELKSVSADVGALDVPADIFGQVPQAAGLSTALSRLADSASSSLRSGSMAVEAAGDLLQSTRKDYLRTDDHVHDGFARMKSRLGH